MNDQATQPPQFAIGKIYIKDVSFETPMSIEAFQQPWKPKFNQQVRVQSSEVDENRYEIILRVTLTATLGEDDTNTKTAFIVEIQQAGIFRIETIDPDAKKQVIKITCPSILLPYAREAIDSMVVKGGFPPVALPPINFATLFMQSQSQSTQQQEDA